MHKTDKSGFNGQFMFYIDCLITVTLETVAQTLKTKCNVDKFMNTSWMTLLCNSVVQYLCLQRLSEEFAQPSITPLHIEYVIMNVPQLYVCMQCLVITAMFRN